MSSLLKNILVFVICLIVVGVGYYVITDSSSLNTNSSNDELAQQQLVTKTEAFIARSSKLNQITIDQSFFTDPVFTSLRSFTTEVPNQAIGRDDIFAEIIAAPSISEEEDNEEETP